MKKNKKKIIYVNVYGLMTLWWLLHAVSYGNNLDAVLVEYFKTIPKTPASIHALIGALNSNPSDTVKAAAADALGRMKAAEGKNALEYFLTYGSIRQTADAVGGGDTTHTVRSACARALAQIKNTNSVSCIVRALNTEKNETVMIDFVSALGSIPHSESVQPLLELLELTKSQSVMLECITSLGKIGNKRAFQRLLAIANGKYPLNIRNAAKVSAESLNWSE